MSNPAPRCSCIICHKEYSFMGIHSHYRIAHTKEGKEKHLTTSTIAAKLGNKAMSEKSKILRTATEQDYYNFPNKCAECNEILPYNKRNNKFCSHKCAATSSNRSRTETGWSPSEDQRIKTSNSLKNKNRPVYSKIFFCESCNSYHEYIGKKKCPRKHIKPQKARKQRKHIRARIDQFNICGEFNKIYYCTCKYCNTKFIGKSQRQICLNCVSISTMKKAQYRFNFNLYHFPDIFDLDKLNKIGFYAPGGKSGKWNPDGLSRDHKVSVSEAIKNNYDPFYITHPMNCELMPHKENDRKKGKSSISYFELILKVDNYEKLKCGRLDSN